MEPRLNILTLGVEDLVTSTNFYSEKFGWKKMKISTDQISFFRLRGMILSLYQREKLAEDATVDADGSGFKGFTMAYNARSKDEVDRIIEKLEKRGVTIVKHPEKVFWGGYSSYVADPDNNLWEIAHNPFLELDEHGIIKG
ncbi:MAG: VOC family protein [Cytophagales bacterium]|nr:VOC family protein [Cytophagales bacterium]